MTSRTDDRRIEGIVSKFMDENFYLPFSRRNSIVFERICDKERQLKGIDVILNGCKIDEKVKFKGGFYNKLIEYPSVELSFIDRRGMESVGWLLKDGIETDFYEFISVFTKYPILDDYDLEYDDIEKLVVLMVSRNSIRKYLMSFGNDLVEENRLLRNCDDVKRRFEHGGFHLTKSTKFAECPINVVIRRDKMLSLEGSIEFEVAKLKTK